MQNITPLRYPGGKSAFHQLLLPIIQSNKLGNCCLAEPFCGGAGASISLLLSELVDRIILNDLDPTVFAFWTTVFGDPKSLVDRVMSTPLNVDQWEKQRNIYKNPSSSSMADLAFSMLFLNRTNRSGIIRNGGLIGGRSQTGDWRMDARFNRDELARRILRLSAYRERMTVACLDGIELVELAEQSAAKSPEQSILLFVDPPYFRPGRNLYMDHLDTDYHENLASALRSLQHAKWVLTYDDCDEIRELYAGCQIQSVPVRYSAHERVVESELFIAPRNLKIPWATTQSRVC